MISQNLLNLWLLFIVFVILFFLLTTGTIANASELENLIRKTAIEEDVDPDLAVAIARVESGMNPKKIGKLGEIGVFQLRPEFHDVKIGNLQANVRTAIRYLKEVKQYCEPTYKEAFFICYNVGPNYSKRILYPKLFKYYIDVMSEMNRIAKDN